MELRISSPCPEDWASMPGDNRIRFCGRCNLNVYNLAVMDRQEIETLVRKTSGRLCGRLYMRDDRTATLSDCPGGIPKRVRRAAAVAVLLVTAAFAWVLRATIQEPDRSIHPRWVRKALDWIDPEPPPPPVGSICPVPPPKPPPPTQP